MKLTDGNVKEAQEIIEQLMKDCDWSQILFISGIGVAVKAYGVDNLVYTERLHDERINRLHELNGTQAPLF